MKIDLAYVTILIQVLVSILAFGLILAWPIEMLWNSIIPQLFNISAITFMQALKLTLLTRLLVAPINFHQVVNSKNKESNK